MAKRKKSLQYKKKLKRIERDVKRGKMNSSMLDELLEQQPKLVKKSKEVQSPSKKKTPIQDKPQPKLGKRQIQKLQKQNHSKTLKTQKKKKKKRKRKKQKTIYNRQISKTSKVPKSVQEIDQQHPPISNDTVANSYAVAVENVRKLCVYHIGKGVYPSSDNANYLLAYFNAGINYYTEEEIGKALLSMDENYIQICKAIIYESKQTTSQDMTFQFIRMITELVGNVNDYWYIQELYDEHQFDDINYE